MTNSDQQRQQSRQRWHADRAVWFVWSGLVLLAVAILPFAVRNSEMVRQIVAMCGFTVN